MPTIADNLDEFVDAIEKNTPIECDRQGQWKLEGSCHRITRLLTLNYYDRNQLLNIAKLFTKSLDKLEKIPVIFQNDMKIIQPQYKTFVHYFNAYQKLEAKLLFSNNPIVNQELNIIKQRIVGLKYRVEALHGGLDKTPDMDDAQLNKISQLASDWKSKQKLYPKDSKNLTERDMIKLREASLYPEFIQLLSTDKSLQNQFFSWTIRDNNGPAQFIEFPSTCARLHHCTIGKRIGRLTPEELNIVKDNLSDGYQKILCLPFYINHQMQRVNILDESVFLTLNDDLTMSIHEIFNTFLKKRHSPGSVEYFSKTGIMNWNNFEFGSWNPKSKRYNRIDFNERAWWKQLPVLEELMKKQIEEKYKISLNDGEWVRCISSTRDDLNFSAHGQHGYIEMAIPLDHNRYVIYPFGKFPKYYPTYSLSQLRLIFRTVLARISYPDENTFYSHRQHATNPKIKTHEEGMAIMDRIRNDILKAIHDNLSFQLGLENCAHWAEETIVSAEGKDAPNPFKVAMPQVKLKYDLFKAFLHAPPGFQSAILNGLRLFAAIDGKKFHENKKIVYKTTQFNSDINKQYQYQPVHLIQQIEDGRLPGVITFGN